MAPAAMMPPQDPLCLSDEGLFTEVPRRGILRSSHSPVLCDGDLMYTLGGLWDVRQNVSNITHLGDALTLIQAYVATVTCGTNPQVRAQNRYLPPS
jgi:hypothetical protein